MPTIQTPYSEIANFVTRFLLLPFDLSFCCSNISIDDQIIVTISKFVTCINNNDMWKFSQLTAKVIIRCWSWITSVIPSSQHFNTFDLPTDVINSCSLSSRYHRMWLTKATSVDIWKGYLEVMSHRTQSSFQWNFRRKLIVQTDHGISAIHCNFQVANAFENEPLSHLLPLLVRYSTFYQELCRSILTYLMIGCKNHELTIWI